MNPSRLLNPDRLAVLTVLAWPLLAAAQSGPSNVALTKHNLTASGPGPVKTSINAEPCIFCHTPHASNPIAPLWNRNDPGTWYQTYDSTTLVATVGQPTGTSRLCLSCHDGTIALTATYNPRTPTGTTIYLDPQDRGYLGTDLRNDHPISFTYDTALSLARGQLADPQTLPDALPLDANGQLQCTTCHDPHNDANGRFLRMANRQSALCRSCHQVTGWSGSAHAQSVKLIRNANAEDWSNLPTTVTTVQDAACENCHRPHNAGSLQRLLRHLPEEQNCLGCHDGSVADKNIDAEVQKISAHNPRLFTGRHDPTENPLSMSPHVECSDCHNPHSVWSTGSATAPTIKPVMQGATGLTRTGRLVSPASYEYEVCYKCHSRQNFAQPVVDRVWGDDNIADEFAPTNASYHPVEAPGKSTDVPSLKPGYTTATILYCTDCHSGDASVKGPHGSSFKPLLDRNYTTTSNIPESPEAYDHCYRCHERTIILSKDRSGFKHHKKHLEEKVPCSACHDPHGVQNNTRLINFDRNLVEPDPKTGRLEFIDDGFRRGKCYLRCHGKDHSPKKY